MLWDENSVEMSNITTGAFSLSAYVKIIEEEDAVFNITYVYNPTANHRQDEFFSKLIAQKK